MNTEINKAINKLNYSNEAVNILKSYDLYYEVLCCGVTATVVAIRCAGADEFTFIGVARCLNRKDFDADKGVEVALSNGMREATEALLFAHNMSLTKDVPTKVDTAPNQPTYKQISQEELCRRFPQNKKAN